MQQGRGFHDLSQNTAELRSAGSYVLWDAEVSSGPPVACDWGPAEVATPIHGDYGMFLGFTCFRQRNIEMPNYTQDPAGQFALI
jgi:hypothetical protein